MQRRTMFGCLFFLFLFGQAAWAQISQVDYSIEWDQANTHYFKVTIEVKNVRGGKLDFRLPAWRPGRYEIQDYARNVVDFSACNGRGRPLSFRKTDKQTWRVERHGAKSVQVSYRYYAHHLDGGSSYLDAEEAYINPITLLMYLPGKEMKPVTLRVMQPAGWGIASAMNYDRQTSKFHSANYHTLVDEPILISPSLRTIHFKESGARFNLVFQGRATLDSAKIIRDVRKIVSEEKKVFGTFPFRHYMFLYHLLPRRFGHAVEHRNATSIVLGPADFSDARFYRGFLGVTAHEFFHAWNVERIRPAAIYYPDYSRENYTGLMWFFEGVTSYYSSLAQARAGMISREQFYKNLAARFWKLERAWKVKKKSVSLSSWDSWITGYGGAPPHTQLSFYTTGQALGILLDLEIRHRTGNKKSLDDVMRYLFRHYAARNRGVPENGIRSAVKAVTGKDFSGFFRRYVDGNEPVSAAPFLAYAGLKLVTTADLSRPAVSTGFTLDAEGTIQDIWPGSAAEKAGLDLGDQVLALNGRRTTPENLSRQLKPFHDGDTARIWFFHKDSLRQVTLILDGNANFGYRIELMPDPTPLQKEILKSWLSGKNNKIEQQSNK